MADSRGLKRLASAYGWLSLEIWLLIALGGGVRAMNAGLACPDWPLCFGDVIPDYHPQVYLEFIHRAMAGMVGLVSLGLAILIWRNRLVAKKVKWLAGVALVLLAAQIILGGLTVLWLLHEKVVAGHLILATSFFAVNLWIYMSLAAAKSPQVMSAPIFWLTRGTAVLVFGQILLGGLVASHYAALTCPEFPLCHGEFIPTLRGTIGLHVLHRLGAYTVMAAVALLYFMSGRRREFRTLLLLVVLQMVLGIANVLFYTPPLITVLHLATGVALFGILLQQNFQLVRSGNTVVAASPQSSILQSV